MKEHKAKIIIGIIILVILYLAYRYHRAKTDNNIVPPPTGGTTGNNNATGTNSALGSSCTNTTILKRGSNCDRVEWSQYEINRVASKIGISTKNKKGEYKLDQDGKFGSDTEKAFQKLLNKKTASYQEVFNKVKSLLSSNSSNTGIIPGTTINDSIKW